MEILVNKMEREKETWFGALSPFPEGMSESSTLLWVCGERGKGSRKVQEGSEGAVETLKTNSECFTISAAGWLSHAHSLITWLICSDWGWLLLSTLVITILEFPWCPQRYIHTCQTGFGDRGLAITMQFPDAQFQLTDPSCQGGPSLQVQSASVRR